MPIVDKINAGLQLFIYDSNLILSFLEIWFVSYRCDTVFAPIGKPHKNPVRIAGEAFFETLNTFEIYFPVVFWTVFNISVFRINSVKNIKGKRDGIMLYINI